jgi:hypothetical protein
VRFADTDGTQENRVSFLRDELQTEEILHLEAVEFLGPIPAKLLEGFENRKTSGFDPTLDGELTALVELSVDQSAQVFDMVPMLLGRLLGQGPMLGLDEG